MFPIRAIAVPSDCGESWNAIEGYTTFSKTTENARVRFAKDVAVGELVL